MLRRFGPCIWGCFQRPTQRTSSWNSLALYSRQKRCTAGPTDCTCAWELRRTKGEWSKTTLASWPTGSQLASAEQCCGSSWQGQEDAREGVATRLAASSLTRILVCNLDHVACPPAPPVSRVYARNTCSSALIQLSTIVVCCCGGRTAVNPSTGVAPNLRLCRCEGERKRRQD